ncbi:MAG: InlB B-repeat-containing protein [Clostridia bacterium]
MKNFAKLAVLLLLILLVGTLLACETDNGPYTITFDTDGGTIIDAIILQKGEMLNPPDPPEKQGYTFAGWYYDKAYSFWVDTSAFRAARNLTLFAKWDNNESLQHKIVFDNYEFADFYTNMEDDLAVFNQTVEVTISPKSGYQIVDGTIVASSPNTQSIVVNKVRDVSEIIKIYSFKMPAERVVLSLEFELRDYNLSVNVMGGEGRLFLSTPKAKMDEEVTYIAVPEAGYRLKEILVDTQTLHGEPFVMKPQDAMFFVYFEKLDTRGELLISITPSEGGAIIASADRVYSGVYVYLEAFPNEGYKLDTFLLDGYPIGDYFLMPSYSVDVEGVFSPIDTDITHSLYFEEGEFGVVSAEKAEYSHGERVELLVAPIEGYYLEALFVNEKFIPQQHFIMPNEDVSVSAVFSSQDNILEHSITVVTEGGTLVFNRETARQGQEVSLLHITSDTGFRFIEGSLRYNGKIFEGGSYFTMPNQSVVVTAIFETAVLYRVNAYESSKGYIIPSKSYAYAGDLITVTVRAKPGYLDTEGNFTFRYWEGDTQVVPSELTFAMPASDIDLEGDFTPRPSAKRNISLGEFSNGTLSVSYSSAPAGTLVHITASPASGYQLSSLYYPIIFMGDRAEVPIADSFIMPDFDISIYAVFVKAETAQLTLGGVYNANKHSLVSAGIKLDYYNRTSQIAQLIPINPADAIYIDALLTAEYNTASFMFEINDITQMARITQGLMLNYSALHANTSFKTIGNIFIVSLGGDAQTDYQIVSSGVEIFDDFILYLRTDGTYGMLAYKGKNIYVSLPLEYNGRSITRIEAGAFIRNTDIVKLSIGAVREIGRGAFDGLAKVTTLDLSGVTALDPLALKDCVSLTRIIVDNSYNSAYYADEQGTLYERLSLNTFRLLRYPVARTETEYTLRSYTYEIAPYAFYKTSLTKVIENSPTSVRIIGEYAFKDAAALSQIELSQVLDIRKGAFSGCISLERVSLTRLRFIGDNVFDLQGERLSIELSDLGVTGSDHFVSLVGNASLRLVVTPDNLDSFRKHQVFAGYSKYFTVSASALKAKEYIIMFESNGGNYINSQRKHNAIPVPPEPPIREGFTFIGWYEDELLTTPFTFTQIYDKEVIPIFAKWE